jgi:hypothetical protein
MYVGRYAGIDTVDNKHYLLLGIIGNPFSHRLLALKPVLVSDAIVPTYIHTSIPQIIGTHIQLVVLVLILS